MQVIPVNSIKQLLFMCKFKKKKIKQLKKKLQFILVLL